MIEIAKDIIAVHLVADRVYNAAFALMAGYISEQEAFNALRDAEFI